MIGANIAPGLLRRFDAEEWGWIDSTLWKKAWNEARAKQCSIPFLIEASDRDEEVLTTANHNAKKAGVASLIHIRSSDIKNFGSNQKQGIVICNPPYGERLGDIKAAERLYKMMGETFPKRARWSYFVLSPHPEFEKWFGRQSNKHRKIYNGKIKCFFHSFF